MFRYLKENIDKVWVVSDLHLHHKNILNFNTIRNQFASGDLSLHDQRVIDNINQYVKRDDILLDLGDVTFRHNSIGLCKQLNVQTHFLILGNHDTFSAERYLNNGITRILNSVRIDDVLFSHFPIHPNELEWGKYIANCHGHTHEHIINDPRYYNMCLEVNDMKPVKMTDLFETIYSQHGIDKK